MKINQFDKKNNNLKDTEKKLLALDPVFTEITDTEELFLVWIENDIYGYAVLDLDSVPKLRDICISKKIRANGYGTKLLEHVINWVTSNNFDTVVVKDHEKLNCFLEKSGFIRENNIYVIKNLTKNIKNTRNASSIALISFFMNVILAIMKIMAGKVFLSSSLYADGFNSFSDSLSNLLVIFGLKAGNKPEDKEHPFGHGKLESVFSLVIGVFIIITGVEVLKSTFFKFFSNSEEINFSGILFYVSIFSIILKVTQFCMIKLSYKKTKNALIYSLSKDYKTDIIVSIFVLVGILLSKYLSIYFDIVVGFVIALYIIKEGFELMKDNALIIIDSQDEELLDKVKTEVLKKSEIENAHDFRMTTSGKNIYIFLDIRVDKNLDISEAHRIAHDVSNDVRQKNKNIKDVFIHVEPMY